MLIDNDSYEQEDLHSKEVEVTICLSLSKTVKVCVDDYVVEEDADEDGRYLSYDYSDCDLQRAVEEQVVLPQNLAEYTENMFNHDLNLRAVGMPRYLKDAIADCKDWCVDDFEVILE